MEKPKALDLSHFKSDGSLGSDERNHEQFGEYLVRKKIISREILNYTLQQQRETGKILGQILQEERFVPEELLQEYSLNRLFNPYRSDHLANLVLKIGKVSPKKLEELRFRQKNSGRSLGSILIDEEIISPQDFTQEKLFSYMMHKQ